MVKYPEGAAQWSVKNKILSLNGGKINNINMTNLANFT